MLYPCPAIGKYAVGSLHTPCICTVPAQPTPFHIAFTYLRGHSAALCGLRCGIGQPRTPLTGQVRLRQVSHLDSIQISGPLRVPFVGTLRVWSLCQGVNCGRLPFAVGVHGASLAVTRTAFCGDFVENFMQKVALALKEYNEIRAMRRAGLASPGQVALYRERLRSTYRALRPQLAL